MEEKTVNDFIKELQSIKASLRKKPIKIQAPNGIYFEPVLKMKTINFGNDVESMVITI